MRTCALINSGPYNRPAYYPTNMYIKNITACALLTASVAMAGCQSEEKTKVLSAAEAKQEKIDEDNRKKVDQLNHDYSRVPDAKIADEPDGSAVYAELKSRYKSDAAKLKQMIEATGAKLVFVILAPAEMTNSNPNSRRLSIDFINNTCAQLGIECVDYSPIVARQDIHMISQIPKDGHWSKKGAEYIASLMAPTIKKYITNSSTVTYKDSERPETIGDLAPSSDEILDGGKDMPYHVVANAQGVRMDHDVKFPKAKKHVLLMGDSGIFCPFLNNEFTIPALLQKQFPEAEIMNTGMICYTLEDYVTLWNDKAKYSEPDLVIIQTNGADITDYYFSHRNHLSRSHKPFEPSAAEEAFYKKHYPTN